MSGKRRPWGPGFLAGVGPGGQTREQRGGKGRPPLPRWLFPLGLLVALEPPALIVLWAVDSGLADGNLLTIALVGGLFVALPALAIFGLAVMWDRRLSGGRTVPGLPAGLTGATASRVSSISLVASTLALGALIAIVLGPWALVAVPPLALSLASAWLMARAA